MRTRMSSSAEDVGKVIQRAEPSREQTRSSSGIASHPASGIGRGTPTQHGCGPAAAAYPIQWENGRSARARPDSHRHRARLVPISIIPVRFRRSEAHTPPIHRRRGRGVTHALVWQKKAGDWWDDEVSEESCLMTICKKRHDCHRESFSLSLSLSLSPHKTTSVALIRITRIGATRITRTEAVCEH